MADTPFNGNHNGKKRLRRGIRWQRAYEIAKTSLAEVEQQLTPEALLRQAETIRQELPFYQQELVALKADTEKADSASHRFRIQHTADRIAAMESAAKQLQDDPEAVLERLRVDIKPLQDYLKMFIATGDATLEESREKYDPARHGAYDERIAFAEFGASIVNHFFEENGDSNMPRYQELGSWLDLGLSHAFAKEYFPDQLTEILLIPRELRRAKEVYEIAVLDAVLEINLTDRDQNCLDPVNRELLASLTTHLGEHQRGADNPEMAMSHKFRHNPAVHSKGVAVLIDKFCDQAQRDIRKLKQRLKHGEDKTGAREELARYGIFARQAHATDKQHDADLKQQLKDALAYIDHWREELLVAALVHDGGENKGEISYGATQFEGNAKSQTRFEASRNDMEKQRYMDFLDEEVKRLIAEKTVSITYVEWETQYRPKWEERFELMEKTDTFVGRFGKACERLHSNQDYARFAKFNDYDLSLGEEKRKAYTFTYPAEIVYDIPKPILNELRNTEDASNLLEHYDYEAVQGPHSLINQLEEGNPGERLAKTMLLDAYMKEWQGILVPEQKKIYFNAQQQESDAQVWQKLLAGRRPGSGGLFLS